MDYHFDGAQLRWAALFEPGSIQLFAKDEDFLKAGKEHEVESVIARAMDIIRERRELARLIQEEERSMPELDELERNLRQHAGYAGVEYGTFEYFKLATEEGAEDGGPLLHSAWAWVQPNMGGASTPIPSGCVTFSAELSRRICSVAVHGGLILFEEPGCRALAGQIPLVLTSREPKAILDLGVWNRLATSAYSWS